MTIASTILSLARLMVLCEIFFTGRAWPNVAGWWGRAALLNGFQALVVFTAGSAWDHWMVRHQPWSFPAGTVGGATAGYVVITFIYYWWHRWRHESDFLWRWLHQIHHSAQRIEVITSFYKHPLEVLANGILSSAIVYLFVGLDVKAAAWAVTLTGIAELFYHWNVKTPHWVGYFIQRPESHCVHHQRGVHGFNYGDLPLWDILFGTFRNPRRWDAQCGFGDEEEHRLGAMLLGREVSRTEAAS